MGIVENPFDDFKDEETEAQKIIKKDAGKIFLNLDIYRKIIASMIRYSNPLTPSEEWIEAMGLLYGYNDGDNVIVTEAIPFTHTKKEGYILKVQFDEEDYALAADIETKFMTKDPPQFIVGWFHSHPGIKVMLSQDDIKNQMAWQTNNPKAFALVFNHERLLKQVEEPARKGDLPIPLKNDPGIKCFRLDDPTRGLEANYYEIEYIFTDCFVDEKFIQYAQEFCLWCAYAFPKEEEVINKYEKILRSHLKKLEQFYNGTKHYINTLVHKHEADRIPQIIDEQIREAEKIIELGNNIKKIIAFLTKFLEYKELIKLIPKINDVFKFWNKADTYIKALRKLREDYDFLV
ncbi:MAG: hypothetical protein ACTSRZ_08370 [Promethearchaeota archaeon]